MKHQSHTFLGERGNYVAVITMRELYETFRRRISYITDKTDLDAAAQAFCVDIETALGIFPNIPDADKVQS